MSDTLLAAGGEASGDGTGEASCGDAVAALSVEAGAGRVGNGDAGTLSTAPSASAGGAISTDEARAVAGDLLRSPVAPAQPTRPRRPVSAPAQRIAIAPSSAPPRIRTFLCSIFSGRK